MWQKRRILVESLSWRFACAEPRNRSPTNGDPHSSPFFALRFQAASASGLSLDRTPLSVSAPLHPTAADSLPPWTSLPPFPPPPSPITGHSSPSTTRESPRPALPPPTWTDRRRENAARHGQGRPTWIDWSRGPGLLIQEPLSATRPSSPQAPPSSRFTYPLGASLATLVTLSLVVVFSLFHFSSSPLGDLFPPFRHPEVSLTNTHETIPSVVTLGSRQLVASFLLLFFRSRLTLGRVVDLDVDCSLIFFCSPSTYSLDRSRRSSCITLWTDSDPASRQQTYIYIRISHDETKG